MSKISYIVFEEEHEDFLRKGDTLEMSGMERPDIIQEMRILKSGWVEIKCKSMNTYNFPPHRMHSAGYDVSGE